MSTTHVPIGPELIFERGKSQPVIFPFTTSARAPLDLDSKTLIFRIGTPGSAALYELEFAPVGDAALGRAGGTVDADIPAGSYEYHVEDIGADRILVRGPCTIRAVIGPLGA